MNIQQLNERVAIAAFHPEISSITLKKVQALKLSIETNPFVGLEETWSSYHAVAVYFDPVQISFDEVKQKLLHLLLMPREQLYKTSSTTVQIPIHYHHDTEDILYLSDSLGLSPREIAILHCTPTYQVAMLGFQPGFPFLLGLTKKLHHPRKKSPSLSVPKGSVAIGGAQTGIYPSESPGGWFVIGHTPLNLFTKPDQFLLKPGDKVEFVTV